MKNYNPSVVMLTMEEDVGEPNQELSGDVKSDSVEEDFSNGVRLDEESSVNDIVETIENDLVDEDEIEIVESKDENVSENIVRKLLNKVRNLTTEQILTVLAISVLVFSAITGILAQKFNEIDQEAASYELRASEHASEARTIESMENQVILREEILLTEVKKLAMQKSLYEAEVELLNISMSQNLNEYNKAMLAKDIISFQQDGITDSEGIFAICERENACSITNITSELGMDYKVYSFQTGVNESVDSYISIFSEVKDEYSEVFLDVSTSSALAEMFLEVGFIIDDDNQTMKLYILDYFQGINGMISLRSYTLNEYEDSLAELENDFAEMESAEATYTDNWIVSLNMRNTYSILLEVAELTNDSANLSFYQQGYDYYDDNVDNYLSLSNYYNAEKNRIGENISDLKEQIAGVSFAIGYAESEMYDFELELAVRQFEKASDNFENYLDSFNFAVTGAENSQELIERLLDDSIANASGYLNGEGEFRSDTIQQLFYDEIHQESSEIYLESEEAAQEAEKVRDKASSVSTSVMFVSIGNVTLGIAGGMVSSAKYGLGSLRSIGVLLGGGVLAGVAGIINSLSILF